MTQPRTYNKIYLIQGEYRVVRDPGVVLSTVLGSCVAACLRDPVAGVGGMNHFLLPGEVGQSKTGDAERLGVHLMELLVNGLLKEGARRERLEGKLFGGANMLEGLSNIGSRNAEFGTRFLANEGIRLVAHDLGGDRGRRVEFFPVSGRVRMNQLARNAAPPPALKPVERPSFEGVVELF